MSSGFGFRLISDLVNFKVITDKEGNVNVGYYNHAGHSIRLYTNEELFDILANGENCKIVKISDWNFVEYVCDLIPDYFNEKRIDFVDTQVDYKNVYILY